MRFLFSLPSPKKAQCFLVGVPFDGTSTFRPGSRFAPNSIREASYGIESYSPYQDKDLKDVKFFDIGDIPVAYSNIEINFKTIESLIFKLLIKGKKVISMGGEHLITYPIVKAYKRKFNELVVVHLDAHSDLANTFRGEQLSHATVMRRVAELVGFKNLYQLGIRSLLKEDKILPKRKENMCMFNLEKAEEYLKKAGDRPIYISLDLDVLDPSTLPGTGTPEPGGISFKELLEFILLLKNYRVVGGDMVELSPHYDPTGVSSITAATILREFILSIGC